MITYAAATSTGLGSSQSPSIVGQPVTFTATVTGGSPSGTVNFQDDGVTISGCSAQTVSGSSATCTTSGLAVGSRSITALYSGDANNLGSTSPVLTQTVQATTTTGVGSSHNPSTAGQAVTFTATVTGGSPSGTVNFEDGGVTIGSCAAQAVSGGSANCTTSGLGGGGHSITAVYSGDTNNATSTSPILMQTVDAAGTTTGLGSSQNPSSFGQSVTFTATVTGASPGGTVNFEDGSATIGSCGAQPLSAGVATCTTSGLGGGALSVTAVYRGDANNTASTSPVLAQTVSPASTTTVLSSSNNPSTAGQSVTFTATVAGVSPTGTVNFEDGSATIGSCGAQPLSAGTATCTTSSLGAGGHGITAVYSGDTNDQGSASSALVQNVDAANGTAPPKVTVSTTGSPSAKTQGANVMVDPGITVSCPTGSSPCTAAESATVSAAASAAKAKLKQITIGQVQFTIPAGRTTKITFKLNHQGTQLLRKLKRLRVTITVITWVAHHTAITTTKAITIKAPALKRPRR